VGDLNPKHRRKAGRRRRTWPSFWQLLVVIDDVIMDEIRLAGDI
jgi:hypothetical protein